MKQKGKNMFDDSLIASTAISSFNNAALFGAQFFAIALLSLPIFYVVFVYLSGSRSRHECFVNA